MKRNEISIKDLKQLNDEHGMTWFRKKELEFFDTTLPKIARIHEDKAYFVSGEREQLQLRRYTIRYADLETGKIHTIHDFMKYGSLHNAKKEINTIING